ncbi:MAG: hypothetical protein H0V17_14580 [Deltaproteobacteria bacterium]|nr:hypothetical protein [Deltaproteobacteria bacterium]
MNPNTRALLDAARGTGPDAAAIARMRGKIGAAIAPAATTGSTAAISTGFTTTKLALLALAIVAATGAGVIATHTRAPAATDRIATLPAEDPPSHSLRTVREAAPPRVTAAADTPVATRAVAEAPVLVRDVAAVAETPAVPVRVVAPNRGIDLAREVELVDRAMTALRGGDAANALAAVRLHATETSRRGQLAEDAAAIEIEALCTLRDPAFAPRLAVFDAQWPASAQRARLTKTCR